MTETADDEVALRRGSVLRDLDVFRNQVVPRVRQILMNWTVLVAVVGSVLITWGIAVLPVRYSRISDFAGMGLAYASVSLAACVSGLVLSLALPGENRLRKWSHMAGSVEGKSLLSDLLFTFFWAACAQLAVLLVSFGSVIFGGTLLIGAPGPLPVPHVAALVSSFTIVMYSVTQLFVVLQTLVQVGVLVIFEEQEATRAGATGD